MALSTTIHKFTRVGPQNDFAPTIWTYSTADTLATVDGSGYFNSLADRIKVGDFLLTYTTTGPAAGVSVCTGNTRDLAASPPVSGVVDFTNFTAIGAIDSD